MSSRNQLAQRACLHAAAFSLILATASAQFAPAQVSETLGSMHYLTQFGDIDGDGDVDAISNTYPGGARTFLNDGLGRFRNGPEVNLRISGGGPKFESLSSICLGDTDGDGDLDLLVAGTSMIILPSNFWEGAIVLYENDGTGHFSPSKVVARETWNDWNALTLGDLDGNGHMDLIALEYDAVYVAPDVGTANPPPPYSTASTPVLPYGNTVRIADMNGDTDDDVLVVTQTQQGEKVSWFENTGLPGQLGVQRALSPPPNVIAGDLSDLDGDGDLDVVVLGFSGAYALDGDGMGGFASPRLLASLTFFPVSGGWNIECGDLDLDGDNDVAFTNAAGVWWTENDGAGGFGAAELLTTGLAGHKGLELIDMDGDGDRDILTAGGDPSRTTLSTSQNLAIPDAGHDCAGAVPVFAPQAAGFDTASGGPSALPWACGGSSNGADFWYSYQVPAGSAAFGVELEGPFDTAIEVYEGTCGALTLVACDVGTGASGAFVTPATAGQTYLVRVGQTSSQDGFGIVRFSDPGPPPPPCFDNQSFELGDLTGWTAVDIPSPFIPLGVSGPGADPGFGLFPTGTSNGDFAFRTGFDGPGPGTIELSQTISVTPEFTPVTFNYRAGWTILNPTAVLDRTFKVVIREASTGALLQSDLLLTAAAQTTNFDTGWQLGEIDLSGFMGQDVQFTLEWYIPESNTGPAHFQIDNVRCTSTPGPEVGSPYCSTMRNSTGQFATIRAEGSSVVSDNDLTLAASSLPPNQSGIFFASRTSGFDWLAGGTSNGHVCVGGSIGRFGAVRNSGPAGAYSFTVDLTSIPQGNGQMSAMAGQVWHFQSWFRDQVGAGSNFTNGVWVLLQ